MYVITGDLLYLFCFLETNLNDEKSMHFTVVHIQKMMNDLTDMARYAEMVLHKMFKNTTVLVGSIFTKYSISLDFCYFSNDRYQRRTYLLQVTK